MAAAGDDSTEVCVIPKNQHCGEVADIQKAELVPGGSLLGCLSVRGKLVLWDPADREALPSPVDGSFSDFCWEEAPQAPAGLARLLTVGAQGHLKLLEVEAERGSPVSLQCVWESPADQLLEVIKEQDHDVVELHSLLILSFAAGRCVVLLNTDWLLQLQWRSAEAELQTTSCCRVGQSHGSGQTAVDHCFCRETLFILHTSGLITMHGASDGVLLASVDLLAYLNSWLVEDEPTSASSSFSSSSFCLLQVSPDLSTAVAVTQSHAAVAVDLNHYFRCFPDHLFYAVPASLPPLQTQQADQDSVSSSSSSFISLGLDFSPDRSWEAHLASLSSKAQQTHPSSSPSSLWSSSLPHLESHQAAYSAHSRVPHGGAMAFFAVPESSTPSLLAVSEFSAQLTFVSPSNQPTTAVLWDLESGRLSYHQTSAEAAPVQRCSERQHRLFLKKAGLFQVLFSVSQQDLLLRLMLFGSAATVDAVCHLNSWGRCSIPIHSLQAGLKNRQLDTVDFYLKSQENVLKAADLSQGLQQLRPALDLLCSAVRDSHSEAQSRQFSEQLLSITVSFIHTQIRTILSKTHHKDEGVQSCIFVLDGYVTQLRSYMKKFPWPAGGSTFSSEEQSQRDEWACLQTEEVVRLAILTNQIPRAQAVLRGRGCPEQSLWALRMEGLRRVFSCLQCRDLQTACRLLVNMGFSVKEQLRRICLYTNDKDLRQFMVEELLERGFLPDEEKQSMAFIREMEKLGSLPASRNTSSSSNRFLQMSSTEPPAALELLATLVEQQRPADEGSLWRNLQLDWVRNWDKSCQTAIILSRLQHSDLNSCELTVLWSYLTALHDHRVLAWVGGVGQTSSALCWPELTPKVVNSSTMCSSYMRENILDLLARRSIFIADELVDMEQLMWRLAQGGGVMGSSPPVPQDFHSLFITFCQDHNLQYLLFTYLEHYRLTPRNCPLLMDQRVSEKQPWCEMLVKIQEVTRDLTDPGLVFQASLTSAQVLLPDSQASFISLLLEGHSLLALASIMFAPGGINQLMLHGQRSERSVDPQVLRMALAPYPKLKAALFPSGPRGHGPSSDITVYHLLQSLPPLDPSRLFGWQAANPFNSTEASELPHFSSPQLVSRFALVENLDFVFYLRHGRPSFAFATFLLQQLSGCSDVLPRLQQVRQQVYRLALQCFSEAPVVSACVCFCELLGICSLKLRVDVQALNAILQYRNRQHAASTPASHLHTLGVKLAEAEPKAAEELIGDLEAAVMDHLDQRGVARSSYEAAQEWALPVQFCQLHGQTLSCVYPAHCASDGHFIHFLLFVQLHNFPPQQVRALAAGFGPTLQAHLSLAFQDLQVYDKWRCFGSEEPPECLRSTEHQQESTRELFQVLLRSLEEAEPCRFLLQEALLQRSPTLAVMAACQQGAELLACLCVWLLTSIADITASEATSHLDEDVHHHQWTLHDLSVIWQTLLGRGCVRPLLRGFELFQRECPLVLVLRMFELCCDYRNFSEAKLKLLDFQKTLLTLRNSSPAPPGGLPVQWVESQASVLLLTMLQRCSSQYDLHRLLQLLADVDKLKSNGPDFRKLSQLSQLLQDSDISLSPRLLLCSSPSVQQEELQALVEALQAKGRYSQAQEVAQLAGLSVQQLLLSQLVQEVSSQRSKRQWGRLDTRVAFWKKCHQRLQRDGTEAEAAQRFFQAQVDLETRCESEELLDIQERCLLLCLAAHWLSQLSQVPVDQLENLEKKLWLLRVRLHMLAADVEKTSVFRLLPMSASPGMDAYEALMKDFSMSKLSCLNTDTWLCLDGLPGPSDEPLLAPEEGRVLSALICRLLDEGSVCEASRLSRYFSLHHQDLWLVLRCRSLASGDLKLEAPEEASEAPQGSSITPSSSVSSLLSFSMAAHPDDEVAAQLQKLVEQCCHGNRYCKQVLGLYQLSKELQCSFSHICSEEPASVLEKLLLSEQPDRFRKAQTFIRAQALSSDVVAELISSVLVQALTLSSQDLQQEKQQVFRPSEGRDSLVQLIKLCEDPNLVGLKLLEALNGVPLRELPCIVELLIVAHDCFSLTCNMEGIVRVLQAARHLSHAHLAPGEHFSLLVRLLTGIGRYNEMTYVFDLLHQHHRFEILLRKKVDADRQQSLGLKAALLDYLKRCLPADSEKHNMVALCFSMRREIGENHEMAARTQLKMIESQAWVVTPELKSSLLKVLGLLKDAAESFSKDACVRQANRCIRTAKLVALQLHLLDRGSDLRVVNLRPSELPAAIMSLLRCYQVFVVLEAYGYSPDWAGVLHQKVVLNGDFAFLEELKRRRPLTSSLFEDIFKRLDGAPSSSAPNVKRLLSHCEDVLTRYRLAYQQKFYQLTKTLLEDSRTSSYLNDRLRGGWGVG